ncbi:MAG TPA: Fe2+-dependent dioxygenase [Xanthomonadaceae bacterium]
MILQLPDVLDEEQLRLLSAKLAADAPWVDGRATAGARASRVKQNLQIAEDAPLARELGTMVLAAMERHPLIATAALPRLVYPPMFNRYDVGMQYDQHVDAALRRPPGARQTMRADISATLFLSPPDSYDGGELLVEDSGQVRSIKLAAGHMAIYPATSVHCVAPVTRGSRLACFLWMQSAVRDEAQRDLLFRLDRAIRALDAQHAGHPAMVELTGVYYNLQRMWAES